MKYLREPCSVVALMGIAGGYAVANVPPAPPLPGVAEHQAILHDAVNMGDIDRLKSVLADNVVLTVDGRIAATGLSQVSDFFKKQASAGIVSRTLSRTRGANQVGIEILSPPKRGENWNPFETCCQLSRVYRLQIRGPGGGKITRIDYLTGDGNIVV